MLGDVVTQFHTWDKLHELVSRIKTFDRLGRLAQDCRILSLSHLSECVCVGVDVCAGGYVVCVFVIVCQFCVLLYVQCTLTCAFVLVFTVIFF